MYFFPEPDEIAGLNHELEQKNKMLEKLNLTDPLTGLPNRRHLQRLAEYEFHRRDRYGLGPLAAGLIDVDHLKKINERYLYPGGDKVMADLAKILANSVRAVDILGRNGGDRFLVIAPETTLAGAQVLGERIRANVEQHIFSYRGENIQVRVSIGFAVVEAGEIGDFEQLRPIAAASLAIAKIDRNCIVAIYRQPSWLQPPCTAADF